MKTRRPAPSAKKRPKQARSRFTVEALLEAAARVLEQEGYDRASTNRIAEVAGVNIASLYQYFPNKDALIGALIDRHLASVQSETAAMLEDFRKAPIEQAIRFAVQAHLSLHRANPSFHRALLQEVPRVERLNPVIALRRTMVELLAAVLEARKKEIDVVDLQQAAFILVQLVDGLTQAAILERPDYVADETYVDEIVRLAAHLLRVRRT